MSGIVLIGLIVVSIVCVVLAQRLALAKGKSPAPWMWSAALLGPLGLVILAALPPNRR